VLTDLALSPLSGSMGAGHLLGHTVKLALGLRLGRKSAVSLRLEARKGHALNSRLA
jgi:hypothetical protein